MSEHLCSQCNTTFKDSRGLKNHQRWCNDKKPEEKFICEHCNHTLSCLASLKRHLLTCTDYLMYVKTEELKKEKEEMNRKIEEEYTTEREQLIRSYERQKEVLATQHASSIKMREDEYKILYKEKEEIQKRYDEATRLLLISQQRNHELEKKADMLNVNMIEFAKKATDKVTTIYNGSTIQNNTLQLQHFDGSLFRDKIIPPSRMVHSISGLVDFLHKLGIGNCYRSVDRSRKAVMWIDHDGKEIRDSNCSQLREKLLSTMEGDIRRQLEYQQKRLSELEAIHGDSYTDNMVSLSDNINFCKQLLNRKAPLMKELQKELSSRAKNKNDTTIDVPRIVGHTKFIAKLEEKMIPDVHQWIGLSFEMFGRWIANQLSEMIEIEGSVLYKEKKFIKIRNDEGGVDLFYPTDFGELVRKIYCDAVSAKARQIYHPYLKLHSSLQTSHSETMVSWLQEENEKQSEEVIKGVLLQKMNR